jgi:5'-3' exonuclease
MRIAQVPPLADGIDPHQVPDFIALRGDASDRIPGAAGVGAVTAAGSLAQIRLA